MGAGELEPALFLGVYHHPPSTELQAAGIKGREVCDTTLNQAAAFLSAYIAKSLLFLRKLPPLE